MLGDLLEGILRFVRESGAPRIAGIWALVAFLVVAFLIRRRQDEFGWKLGCSLLAFAGAAGSLLWWSLQPGATYYKHVDELVTEARSLRLRRADVLVHGCVVPGSIQRRGDTDEYRFEIGSLPPRRPALIEARYHGWVPDNFRSGAEIVARGALDGNGRFDVVEDGIMAKCPSKYDSSAGLYLPCAEPGS